MLSVLLYLRYEFVIIILMRPKRHEIGVRSVIVRQWRWWYKI